MTRNDIAGAISGAVRHTGQRMPVIGRLLRRKGKARGAAPGTVVHTGPRRIERVRLHWFEYDNSVVHEHTGDTYDRLTRTEPALDVTWLDVTGLHDTDMLSRIGQDAGIHPLVREDIGSVGQRAKLEEYGDDAVYIVLRMLTLEPGHDVIAEEQVSLYLTPRFVISFQEAEGDVFDPVRQRIRDGKGQLRGRGADYLAYALIDAIVDSYFGVLESLGEHIDALEQEVVTAPDRETVRRVYAVKRELLVMRRAVWPLRDVLNAMVRDPSRCISAETRVFLRDAYDHTVQVMDTVETLRDIVSGLMDIYLSSVSNRMNEVMKVLTIIATMFIPLTFLVGVYGMNFERMPELGWWWAYPSLWVIMLAIAGGMLAFFRRKGWL